MLKTEKEIREEIENCEKTVENYRKSHKDGKIPFDVLKSAVHENGSMIAALKWVLGENERYD